MREPVRVEGGKEVQLTSVQQLRDLLVIAVLLTEGSPKENNEYRERDSSLGLPGCKKVKDINM